MEVFLQDLSGVISAGCSFAACQRHTMTKVKVRHGESFEAALRRFNRMVQKSGVLQTVKDREFFVSDSEKRKMKKKEIQRRIQFENRRN